MTAILPALGSIGGGASMTIIGTGFKPGVVAIFDGISVPARFDNRDIAITMYLQTPPHADGAVDVVVMNPDGGSVRVSSGHACVSATSFDPNGPWTGFTNDGSDRVMAFTIQNNMLISASCYSGLGDKFSLTLSSPSPVSNGEFSFYWDDGIGMSGRMVSASEIVGTMNVGGCGAMAWRTYPRSQFASQ